MNAPTYATRYDANGEVVRDANGHPTLTCDCDECGAPAVGVNYVEGKIESRQCAPCFTASRERVRAETLAAAEAMLGIRFTRTA